MTKKCALDGHDFQGEIYQFVENIHHDNNEFQFNPRVFCSAACVRRYIAKFHFLDPKIGVWTEMHFRNDRHIMHCLVAPDPVVMSCFNYNGIGLTIDQFRDTINSMNLVENQKHLHIEKLIFVPKPQKNFEKPFVTANLNLGLHQNEEYSKMEFSKNKEENEVKKVANDLKLKTNQLKLKEKKKRANKKIKEEALLSNENQEQVPPLETILK